jgi:hypothetical protein
MVTPFAGDETVCCYSSGTFARRLSPFNNLVENSFVLDFDCDNGKGKGGDDEKQNDKHSKFKPDASEHSKPSRQLYRIYKSKINATLK